jgi:hypothetical protein
MATREEIEETYDFMDEIFRLNFGENADLTCAMYNGDFSKTLAQEQAERSAAHRQSFLPGARHPLSRDGLPSILQRNLPAPQPGERPVASKGALIDKQGLRCILQANQGIFS